MQKTFFPVLTSPVISRGPLPVQKHIYQGYLTKSPLLFFIACLLSCGTVKVYNDPGKPVYLSNEKTFEIANRADSLTVLTFNIKEAEKIKLAIAELKDFGTTRNIDI